MVGHIVGTLRQSPLVKDVKVTAMVEEASAQFLRGTAEMRDGSLLTNSVIWPTECLRLSYC